jgi:hypothetical protein
MAKSWIIDLTVAASFVRSIETENHELNFELGLLADRIDALIADVRPSRAPLRPTKDAAQEIDNA